MKTLVCHPDNLKKIKKELKSELPEDSVFSGCPLFNVRTDSTLDRDKPTGRYVLPSGTAVEKEKIRITYRFIEYGPEDLPWLLYAGIVTEERELLFYLVDDLHFKFVMQDASFMPRLDYRSFYPGTA